MATLQQRSTSQVRALSTTSSQNTAPVLEYRCMFTHDGHKKSKKWHDGTLRFHTFNKRVMVYDDSKSLVGGLHYRAQEEFGEGLEFRLDRPIDVVVEEKLGQTSTDLTPLLAKENRPPHHNSVQLAHAGGSHLNSPNPHAKPKSIREVLGASQGQLGRPRVPLQQSPFDLRKSRLNQQALEPPAKRRRLDSRPGFDVGQSNFPEPSVTRFQSQVLVEAPINRNDSNDIVEMARPVAPVAARRAGIAKDARLQRLHPTAQRTTDRPTVTQTSIAVTTSSAKTASKTKERAKSHGNVVHSESQAATREAVRSAQARREVRPFHNQAVLSSTARLRFKMELPRRKLMYKALLPLKVQSASAPAILQSDHSLPDSPPSRRQPPLYNADRLSSPTRTHFPEIVTESEIPAEHTTVSSDGGRQPSPHMSVTNSNRGRPSPGKDRSTPRSGSPMFVSQGASQPLLEEISGACEDDFEVPSLTQDDRDAAPVLPGASSQETDHDHATAASQSNQNHANSQRQDAGDTDNDNATAKCRSDTQGGLVVEKPVPKPLPASYEAQPRLFPASPNHVQVSSSPQPQSLPLPLPAPPLQEHSRPFRRVVSEHGLGHRTLCVEESTASTCSEVEDAQHDQHESAPFTDDTLQIHHQHRIRSSAPAQAPASLLRKSTSDITVQHRITTDIPETVPSSVTPQTHPPNSPNQQQAQETTTPSLPNTNTNTATGPWTPIESFLLFPRSRWPPDRPIPDYGQSIPPSANPDSTISRTATAAPIDATNQRYGDPARLKRNLLARKKYGTFGSARFVSQK